MTIKNIEELRTRVKNCRSLPTYSGFVCIGYGMKYPDLDNHFGIHMNDIHAINETKHEVVPSNNWCGTNTNRLYYVTEYFYNNHIEEKKEEKIVSYKDTAKSFIELTGLKKGSKVRVVSKAKSQQYGWRCHWNPAMDDAIGKTFTVDYICGIDLDVRLILDNGDGYYFPFFCLEVLEAEDVIIPLESGEYSATVKPNGDIEVGCQKISYAKLDEIHKAATKAKNS